MAQLGAIDETVRMPAAVKRSVQRAEAIIEAGTKKDMKKTPAVPPPDPFAKETVAAPVPAPAETAPQPAPEPQPAPAPAAEVTAQVTPPAPAPEQDWERQYKAMKGRFDQAEKMTAAMRNRMAELEAALAAANTVTAPPTVEERFEKLLSDKEIEEFGPELLGVVGRKAREELNPVVVKLQRRIDQLEGQLSATTKASVKNARQNLISTMDAECPQWRQLDEDQRFLQWLALPERYSGAIRHELLKTAYERNDTPRVLAFFQGFLAEEAASGSAEPHSPTPPAPPPASSQVPLESLAAPGRARSTAPTTGPVEKPFITRSQITQFYADIRQGKYRGKEAEKDRLEQMIFDARADGRIV